MDYPETCPSLCAERSHPGQEHDEAEHGCRCAELCEMGPTCPGANAGLDRGCWRTRPTDAAKTLRAMYDERLRCDACRCGQHGDCSDGDCLCPGEFCNGWPTTGGTDD